MASTTPAATGRIASATAEPAWHERALTKLQKEVIRVLLPTIYFAVGFNLIVLSTNLVLAQYLIHLNNFLVATTSALIVGKAVLVADKCHSCDASIQLR